MPTFWLHRGADQHGLTTSQCGLIFGATIAVFTSVMIPAGRFMQRRGARVTALIGALLFAAGYVMASFSQGDFLLLLISLSLVAGAGIGFGYICPLTVAMQWFPDKKGLVTGVSVAGFGAGAIFLSFVAEHLLVTRGMDVMHVFRFIGLGCGLVAVCSALLLREPPRGSGTGIQRASGRRMQVPTGALTSRNFLILCLGMFCGTFAGLLVVGNLKPMALSLGLGSSTATVAISVFALGNAMGRIGWGQVHDRFGSRLTILISQAFLGFSMLLFLLPPVPALVLAAVLLTGIGFGGCFVVYASSVVEMFGISLFPRLYPICFLWYGLAALIGPSLGGIMADASGSYGISIVMSVLLVLTTVPLTWILFQRKSNTRLRNIV
ncbi:MAG: MFS transporter [Desulfomicrobium sp.]|nr:MFS transporter [Desulfomicrobium sp.]